MNEIREAIGLLRRDRELRTYVWGPLALAGGVFAFLFVAGIVGILALRPGGDAVGVLLALAYAAAFLFFGGALFLAIAALCSSWLWDPLSREVERKTMGYVVDASPPWPRVWSDSLARFFASLGLALVAWLLGLVTAGVGAVLVAGWIASLDVTSNAFLRRGVTFGGQGRRLRRLPGWGPFLIACGVIAVIPFVNVLMLPVLVTAGTLKVARADL